MQPAADLDQAARPWTASSARAGLPALRPERQRSEHAVAVLATLGLLILAFLPLLSLHVSLLWARPHYQFFPFVLLGAAILLTREIRTAHDLHAGKRLVSLALVFVSWMLLALSVLIYSPWLAAVAALMTLLALIHDLGGPAFVRQLLPGWVFLWLAVPLPVGLDAKLVRSLQTVAVKWSDAVLDLFGVFHYMEGNAVAVADRVLLIEQSCSGIHSLMTCLAGTLFLVFWRRSGVPRLIILVIAAVGWVIMGNVARIVAVAYMLDRWGIDLSEGWRHEVLGFFMALITLTLIASTNCAFQSLVDVVDWIKMTLMAWRNTRLQRPAWDPLKPLSLDPGQGLSYVPWEADEIAEAPAPEVPTARWTLPPLSIFCRTWLSSWPAAAAFGVLAVVQLALLRATPPRAPESTDQLDRAFSQWREASLPKRSGPFELIAFNKRVQEPSEHYSLNSLVWNYEWNGAQAAVSVDYPFKHGWHDLPECYRSRGWMSQQSMVIPAPDGSEGSVAVETFVNPQGRFGYLLYGFFDANGAALKASQRLGVVGSLKARLTNWDDPRRLWGVQGPEKFGPSCICSQVQLFVESELPLNPPEEQQARAFFEEVRMLVRRDGPKTHGGAP